MYRCIAIPDICHVTIVRTNRRKFKGIVIQRQFDNTVIEWLHGFVELFENFQSKRIFWWIEVTWNDYGIRVWDVRRGRSSISSFIIRVRASHFTVNRRLWIVMWLGCILFLWYSIFFLILYFSLVFKLCFWCEWDTLGDAPPSLYPLHDPIYSIWIAYN